MRTWKVAGWGGLAAVMLGVACGPGVEEATEDTPLDAAPEEEVTASHARCTPPYLVRDIRPGPEGSSPFYLTDADGTLFFFTEEVPGSLSLWRSRGRESNTLLLKTDITYSDVVEPEAVGGTFFFTTADGVHGRELWASDGTVRGTRQVADIRPGPEGSEPGNLTRFGKRLFFTADDGVHGRELWMTDGTARGTRLVRDIRPGPASSDPGGLIQVERDRLDFVADDGIHGAELWTTDGTRSGTRLVEDIRPGPEGSTIGGPGTPVAVDGTLYFSADDGVHGIELWKSEGTARTTRLVEDIIPGPRGSFPQYLAPLGRKLIFFAENGSTGLEPWRSDGTARGTRLIEDVRPGPLDSIVGPPASTGERVFFPANDGVHGDEMWVTDGTRAGTRLVADINPTDSSIPTDPPPPYVVGDVVAFQADDGVHGLEPWWTDGTRRGTDFVDIAPGAASSAPVGSPFNFERSGSRLFLRADDGTTGLELWALPTACLTRDSRGR